MMGNDQIIPGFCLFPFLSKQANIESLSAIAAHLNIWVNTIFFSIAPSRKLIHGFRNTYAEVEYFFSYPGSLQNRQSGKLRLSSRKKTDFQQMIYNPKNLKLNISRLPKTSIYFYLQDWSSLIYPCRAPSFVVFYTFYENNNLKYMKIVSGV